MKCIFITLQGHNGLVFFTNETTCHDAIIHRRNDVNVDVHLFPKIYVYLKIQTELTSQVRS